VRHTVEPLRGAPGLHLEYELTRNGRPIGRWRDRLRWRAAEFAFAPFESTVDALEPLASRVRDQIGRARVYSAVRPLRPADDDSSRWMGDSGLMDVLSPACAPSLLHLTRPFAGKWMLDAEKTAAANPPAASPSLALVVAWDRGTLTIRRSDGGVDAFRLDGTRTTVRVGQTTGRAAAVMDGERMVVTINVEGSGEPRRRAYYLDGPSLVIEESGGSEATTTRAYYVKS
jgi:hypothetical protein